MNNQGYEFKMVAETTWRVGYAHHVDKIFIFKIDSDDVYWAFSQEGLSAGFVECIKDDSYIDMGEL